MLANNFKDDTLLPVIHCAVPNSYHDSLSQILEELLRVKRGLGNDIFA